KVSVEIMDQAEAIAAELQAVGAGPHAVFADVERVFPHLRRAGIAIGDDHLGERRPVQDRPLLAAVAVAEMVQRQPLAGIEADDEAPLLPANLAPLNLETRSGRLLDLQRLDVAA